MSDSIVDRRIPVSGTLHDTDAVASVDVVRSGVPAHASVAAPDSRPLMRRVLSRLAIGETETRELARRAGRNGSGLDEEIIVAGLATEAELADAIAMALGVPVEPISRDATTLRDGRGGLRMGRRHLRSCDEDMRARFHLAPPLEALDHVAATLASSTGDVSILRITTSSDIQAHRAGASCEERSSRARLSLAMDRNALSARDTMRPLQAAALTSAAIALAAGWALWPAFFWTGTHLMLAILSLACIALRAAMLVSPVRLSRPAAVSDETSGRVPIYSVLIALHRETAVVPSLVKAMAALHWPRSRLEVLFVCEANDPQTIAAVEAAIAGEPNFAVVVTPGSFPQTKPKALNFALPLARGEFLVLYDAEDRPDPEQLHEAYAHFRGGSPNLACLQAPLTVRNFADNWWSAQFATEYAILFRRVLPWLASHRLPIPLGGTSNHFRRAILTDIGGWDSHNVAEDADLGIRLARHGFEIGVIGAPTSESTTTRWLDWRNQRTRWIKGWLQTWLVHMRDPVRTWRDLGPRRFAVFQLLFAGMIGASVMHLFFGAYVANSLVLLLLGHELSLMPKLLMGLDLFNIAAAWLVHALLAGQVLSEAEKPVLRHLPTLWLYWFAASFAGLRALRQLILDPHRWEKTPHHESIGTAEVGPDDRVSGVP